MGLWRPALPFLLCEVTFSTCLSIFALISLLCFRFSAVGLMVSLRRRRGGRRLLSVVVLAMAAFASLSALLLPAIPTCPAVHLSVSKYFVVPLFFCTLAAVLKNLSAICWLGVTRSDVSVTVNAYKPIRMKVMIKTLRIKTRET